MSILRVDNTNQYVVYLKKIQATNPSNEKALPDRCHTIYLGKPAWLTIQILSL